MTEEPEFKPKFIERYKQLTDFEIFKRYSLTYIRKAIRVNTLKISIDELRKRLENNWKLEPIPWCKEGFWIDYRREGEEKRYDIGNVLEHFLGYIYVQEAASMIPPVVLNPKPGETILDMCAAPGSKSSQIAATMQNKGLLVASDVQADRLNPLGINLQRMGVSNSLIVRMPGHWYNNTSIKFDKILVDAPCSGTGTIRKSYKTLSMWGPNMIKKLCAQQKQLIATAYQALKPGGILVYSTCTMEPEEDEGVVSWLVDKHPDAKIEKIELDIKRSPAVMKFGKETYNPQVKECLRIWPQDNDTEGFFVAKIRKQQ